MLQNAHSLRAFRLVKRLKFTAERFGPSRAHLLVKPVTRPAISEPVLPSGPSAA